MLPSSWEDTRAQATQAGRHMLTHSLYSGDKGSALEDSGQMLAYDTGSADLVMCGRLACGPVGSCFPALFSGLSTFSQCLCQTFQRQGH